MICATLFVGHTIYLTILLNKFKNILIYAHLKRWGEPPTYEHVHYYKVVHPQICLLICNYNYNCGKL